VRQITWLVFFLSFSISPSFAGTKEERPDREMLKLMELLKEREMIQNLDLMRQLERLDRMEESPQDQGTQKSPWGKTKDRQK